MKAVLICVVDKLLSSWQVRLSDIRITWSYTTRFE